MTWVKVTCGLRISLRRIKVCFIINRAYDRYNVWIVNKRSMILDKWSKYLLYFCNDKRKSIWDAVLLEKGYLAKWPSLPSAETYMYVEQPIIIRTKRLGILIFCCEFWNKKIKWDRMPISKAHILLHPVLHIKLQTSFPRAKSCCIIVQWLLLVENFSSITFSSKKIITHLADH